MSIWSRYRQKRRDSKLLNFERETYLDLEDILEDAERYSDDNCASESLYDEEEEGFCMADEEEGCGCNDWELRSFDDSPYRCE